MYVLTGEIAGRKLQFSLQKERLTVGRGSKNDIDLDHSSVSRKHAEITVAGDRITIQDLNSANGTKVNGKELIAFQPCELRVRDLIQIAKVRLYLYPEGIEDVSDSGPLPPVVLRDQLLSKPEEVLEKETLSWDEITSDITPAVSDHPEIFRVLFELGKLIIRPQPLGEVLDHLLALMERVVVARRIMIVMTDTTDGSPVVRAARPALDLAGDKAVLSTTIISKVLNEREALLLNDAQSDPAFADHGSVVGLNIRSAMVAPLFDNREVIGLLYADHDDITVHYDATELRVFTLMANLIAVKITNARLLEFEEEAKAARQVQKRLLPAKIPTVPGCDVAARMFPCTEVAGDLYDVREMPDGKFAIVFGDVTGHGMAAAMLAVSVVTGLDILGGENLPLEMLAERLHQQILSRTETMRFVTFFYGLYDPDTGRLEYFNAGHNPPHVMLPDDKYTKLNPTGTPLGLLPDAPPWEVQTFDLPEQSMLCIFSDGIPEAMAEAQVYGEERLLQSARRRCHDDLEDVIDGMFTDLHDFLKGEPLEDDATLLLLRRCPEAERASEQT
jgi:sigma-B regulation protein RsbU (phosphoserine phosphatase)